jgi:hypothetical protein
MTSLKSRSCSFVFLLKLDSNQEHVVFYLRFVFCAGKGLSAEGDPVYNQKFRNEFLA